MPPRSMGVQVSSFGTCSQPKVAYDARVGGTKFDPHLSCFLENIFFDTLVSPLVNLQNGLWTAARGRGDFFLMVASPV
jgi:hypothetical protein